MKKSYSIQELKQLYELREKQHVSNLSGARRHELLFEPYGVTPTEFRTLAFLLWNPKGVEPSVVADSLMVLRQTMTKVIDALESRGLATRAEHPTDRRRVHIRLLPAGIALARTLLELETDYFEGINSHFTPEELEFYRKLFWRMQTARDEELQRILQARAGGDGKQPPAAEPPRGK